MFQLNQFFRKKKTFKKLNQRSKSNIGLVKSIGFEQYCGFVSFDNTVKGEGCVGKLCIHQLIQDTDRERERDR